MPIADASQLALPPVRHDARPGAGISPLISRACVTASKPGAQCSQKRTQIRIPGLSGGSESKRLKFNKRLRGGGFVLVPGEGFELPTFGLQNRCSTTELTRLSPENTRILLFRKRTKTKLPPDCHRNWAKNERPPKMLGAGFVLRASPSWRVPV